LVTRDLEIARRAKRALVLIDRGVIADTANFGEAARALHRGTLAEDPEAVST
jgi:hypothetical protein